MYCKKCGQEVNDEAVVCVHCGCAIKEDKTSEEMNKEKTGIGVLMGLFLGIIGLIIGIVIYPQDTIARKTFLKGWGIAFGISMCVLVVIYIIVYVSTMNAISTMYDYPY